MQIDQRVTSKKKSKVKEQEAAIQAAQRAAEADAAASVTVKIYSVNETEASISLECSQVDLAGQRPTGLHGGALLGIAVGRHIKSGAALVDAHLLTVTSGYFYCYSMACCLANDMCIHAR